MENLHKPFETVTSLFRRKPKLIGLAPGTLVHVGQQKVETTTYSLIDYDVDNLLIESDVSFERCLEFKALPSVSWINLDGLHDISEVETFGSAFGLHALIMEDILNTGHRPKIEIFDDYILIILKMFDFNEKSGQVQAEQISIVLTRGKVLSFQERPGDVFDEVRGRLQHKNRRMRQRGADYLTYALIDSIIDSYFHVLEKIADRLEILEKELIREPTQETLQQIHNFKGQLILLRKSIWPLRDLVNTMLHDESPLIQESTQIYLRDLYDHSLQIFDTLESFRDTASGLVDLYMSSVSYRMNEVIQVLTIMATLFIPLTFVAGIYGMNFDVMPELRWRWGYPVVMGLMLVGSVGMLVYFKKKKWF